MDIEWTYFNIISSMQTENFQMYKLILEKADEPEMKLPISVES